MGRAIIRDESPEDPGKRTRLWHKKEASDVLRNLTGTRSIKGLMLHCPSTFETKAFTKMLNLELLLLDNVKLSGSYEDFPKKLIWLSWRGFSLKSIPANFCMENLVVLDLRKSSLQHVWNGTKILTRLKILNLSHSHRTTSDLSGLPNLEKLILKDCINLVDVDESIGNLGKLVFLNLKDCKSLMKLPKRMNMLRSLEELILTGCPKLVLHDSATVLVDVGMAGKDSSINEFLSGKFTPFFGKLKSLQSLFWGCEHLVEVESLLNIKPLRSADIEMTRYMDLFNLKSISSTDVEMINYLTGTTRKAPVQVLYECGIYSIFFHGSKIPDGFGFTIIYRSVLSVIVPSHPFLKIRGLNSCVLYAREPGLEYRLTVQHLIKVSNQTKGLMWTYSPLTVGLPTEKEDMLWLSHFRFANNELEYGDELRVSVEMHEFVRVKEFGIQLVYEPERPPSSQNNVVAGDVSLSASEYQMWTGKYFLSNHGHRTHQAQFRRRQENPAHIEFSFGPELLFHKLFKARGPFETVVKLRAYPADSPSASPYPFWLK
ncbi:hypothetical protein FF1_019721 [Malus domestica]